MLKTLPIIAVCLVLSGCTLRVAAAGMAAFLEVYSTEYIEGATAADRAKLKATLVSIKPYTDQVAASVNEKIALIESMETP